MKQLRVCLLMWVILVNMAAVVLISSAGASEICEDWVTKVVSVQGTVEARRADQKVWLPVRLNDIFCPGDMIRTQERSRAAIVLFNESILRLDERTTIMISGLKKKDLPLIDLIRGAVHFFSRIRRGLKVTTPFVNGFVEGTEFYVRVETDHTFISIFEGHVATVNDAGRLSLSKGQSAIARSGTAPALRMVAQPRDAVQWALYYPPILAYRAIDFPGGSAGHWQAMVRHSLAFYWKGDLTRAFLSLESAPEGIRDPHFFIYRAGLLLSVGRFDEAELDIEKAANLDPGNSHIFSLTSIIALTRHQKRQARDLAQKAVELDAESATARIALSYAQQAGFDLQGALSSLQIAVALDSENALAWARLAELFLSVGDLDKAVASAQKAVALNPFLERTQTILGFAYISRINTEKAKQAFNKAIELDPAAPLPRLGLGLAIIREGDVKKGRGEIEVAASLDPGNALIRSYLGKAYFEEKRDALVSDQFATAKALDPDDPTPWYYDAIFKQTVNRPVEALHDLQTSIELNDNRAVYRSRLLLDEDLAARSASLSRIYSDLNFQHLALVEGYKSLHTDPANYSAHRFLADSYSIVPRHDIARASELLQSQLLQPVNILPVKPDLAEGSLFVMEESGSANPSFNEFSQMFNRNRMTLNASSVVGGNSTWAEEIVPSGVWDKLSFSLGQFHYETRGFRENNDQDQNIYNAFAQVSLSPKTSVQAEYRYTDQENGDLSLRFDPDFYLATQRRNEQTESIRLGYHHAFTPQSHFITSLIYQNKEEEMVIPEFWVDISEEEDGFMGEIQHLFRSERFNIINGVGYFSADRKTITPPEITETDIYHTNFYTYSYLNYPDRFTWIIGGSGDLLEGAIVDNDQFNPKFGIIWNPSPATTFRAAGFRTLQRTLISSQTLEPTQVAGFNQFFNDGEGTEAWRYGMAADQKFYRDLYGGAELSRRDMTVPFNYYAPFAVTPEVRKVDWKEKLLRTYLYWTPKKWLALSAEYLYEKLERKLEFSGDAYFTEIKSHRLPLGISFFHPAGFSFWLKTTYVYQDGQFLDFFNTIVPGDDQFWIVDAGISYRLPKRSGLITLEVKNLLDKTFNFEDTDPSNQKYSPDRLIVAKITVSF
ncbi:FecR domain-containing protein [Desulfobacula sp.]|uniref:FecR domain-containing protein n=1 Tax=Desulfobacula sp. TaxID=2593537 RepID=UPI00260A22C2|nr:FecR domain-containing protein [Desulfobacula sp.]